MYRGVFEIWGRYWAAYGGLRSLLTSFYLHLAILISAISFPFWWQPGWWDTPIQILPNMLGFTLGGMTVFLGIIEPRIVRYMGSSGDRKYSDLTEIVATFVHFVVVQALALLAAVVCKALYVPIEETPIYGVLNRVHLPPAAWSFATRLVGWPLAFALFVYALTLALATTLEVFRVSQMIEAICKSEAEKEEGSGRPGGSC